MAETITALSQQLFDSLQQEAFALLGTVDHESGGPGVNAISWLFAVDEKTVRFAVDARSRIVANIRNNPQVNLTYIGAGSVHAIYGEAALVTEALEEVPFKLACFDIGVTSVRDAMFYGARISCAPEYEKTYDKRAADKLDTQVFHAMKKA
ncbi:pyridoxamine 5'-phosphate oxidase family protein [Paenibacillus filicis]|uniref:Pyridoxamine 5'-phosphate oxidase family protein n=1 Tax=Paenibacillus gyeongsangnamensis TaxID=3388067 RepID=A0ABT4Q2U8_9BACL|nr:pyridoxamine 5'-phosphate oxidase family protein [Paenibacillus filicis]MCZ8511203.1 pyridoxamine 5'-phosphate oxidase family protein [Paenibacillus filicis]